MERKKRHHHHQWRALPLKRKVSKWIASGTIKSRYAPLPHHLKMKALINQSALVVEESQRLRNFQFESPETMKNPTFSLLNQLLSGRFEFTLTRSFLQKVFERANTKRPLGSICVDFLCILCMDYKLFKQL
jgi:hypothetical protein